MTDDEQERLIANLAASIAWVSPDRDDIVTRAVANFAQADQDFGRHLEAAIRKLRD
jgi:catalase